jgi:hypothetical protein
VANLKIGLHEQMRLQPQITAAVDAPVVTAEDLGARVLDVLIPSSRNWPRLAHDPLAKVIGWLAARVRREARKVTQEVVTDALMVLAVPVDTKPTYAALALDVTSTRRCRCRGAAHPFLDSFVAADLRARRQHSAAGDWCDLR